MHPPWSEVPSHRRRMISISSVERALGQLGQLGRGPVTDAGTCNAQIDAWRQLLAGPAILGARLAAVLVALYDGDDGARVILTERSLTVRTHQGQVSFPGGGIHAGEDPAAAALREANEEIGLAPEQVRILGWLRPETTLDGASIMFPLVGALGVRPLLEPDPSEVANVFDVSLAELSADGVVREEQWGPERTGAPNGQTRAVWFFDVAGETVWGATARILSDLLCVALGLAVPAAGTGRSLPRG
jgi:8-oxo-dGTP pyrophosphatase MutT (NUDIX family)